MREITIVFDPQRKFVLYFTLLGLVVFLGPFGTYEKLTLWDRLVFWTLDITAAAVFMHLSLFAVFGFAALQVLHPFWRLILGVSLGAVPTTAAIVFLYRTLAPGVEMQATYPLLFVEVVVFTIPLMLAEFLLWPRLFPAAKAPAPAPKTTARLFDRLSENLRQSDIISISMQDHYAQIVTTKGNELLLIRLSDAIDLLDGYAGAQVHRSHWVARCHATGIIRDGRKHQITLTDGRSLPVSASYLDAAQALIDTP